MNLRTTMDDWFAEYGVYKNKDGLYCFNGKSISFSKDNHLSNEHNSDNSNVIDFVKYKENK